MSFALGSETATVVPGGVTTKNRQAPTQSFSQLIPDLLSNPEHTVSPEHNAEYTGAGQDHPDEGSATGNAAQHSSNAPQQIIAPEGLAAIQEIENALAQKKSVRRPSEFVAIQKWEGWVESVRKTRFVARLHDLTNTRNGFEIADLPLEDVGDESRPLVKPGAVFYLTIGYRLFSEGRRERASNITFRRLPVWRSEELQKAERIGKDRFAAIDWE